MLKKGDAIGIVGCSDGLRLDKQEALKRLCAVFKEMGLQPVCSEFLYVKEAVFSGTGAERAESLLKMYQNEQIKAIFDISGGNVGNEVLPTLDFSVIAAHPKPYFGYSDLTTIINSIYSHTKIKGYLYSAWNLIGQDAQQQQEQFYQSLLCGGPDLYAVSWKFIRGTTMRGIVVGGNIRCLMKLAGTSCMPDFTDKILFLEAYSGDAGLIASLMAQLNLLGVLDKIKGILLGTFSYMEEQRTTPTADELILRATVDQALPIATTRELGHGSDSKCIVIGAEINL